MYKSLVSVAVLLIVLAAGCAHRQGERLALDEVFLTGREQAVVDSLVGRSREEQDRRYGGSLDQAFAVLLARAYPAPQPRALVHSTVASLGGEFRRQMSEEITAAQIESWVAAALETNSFQSALKDMEVRGGEHLDRRRLIEAGLRGMLKATGSGSACVLTAAQAAELNRAVRNRKRPAEPGLLGIRLDGWPTVEVIPDMPAAEAGLQTGDKVLAVDGETVSRIDTGSGAAKVLRGPAGERVSLTVERGGRTLAFEVRRVPVAASKITTRLVEPGIARVTIPTFEGAGIGARARDMVRRQVDGGTSIVMLDLRDNRGGRPEEANALADVFLDGRILQVLEFRNGGRIAFRSNPGALDVDLIVLTNRNTGSAAEMLVLALQGGGRTAIIGERTAGTLFGKDIQELDDGHVILFRSEPIILSRSGKDYSETGVPPDIVVSDERRAGEDKILQRAVKLARSRIGRETQRQGRH